MKQGWCSPDIREANPYFSSTHLRNFVLTNSLKKKLQSTTKNEKGSGKYNTIFFSFKSYNPSCSSLNSMESLKKNVGPAKFH